MKSEPMKEPQYEEMRKAEQSFGRATLGLSTNQAYLQDPKTLVFRSARYKFVAHMLRGKKRVLEVGCGDAFMSRIVQQEVGGLIAVDFDPVLINDALERTIDPWPIDLRVHDFLDGPILEEFDAAYSLDVLEHIQPAEAPRFVENVSRSLVSGGVAVFGMPSIESQAYASWGSRIGHVNCMSGADLAEFLSGFFEQVFLFSANDEVVHTGFSKMAHYLICLCVAPKSSEVR